MNRLQRLAALSATAVVATAATMIAGPAVHAAERPSCPTPSKAEQKRSHNAMTDKPPRGATAIKGVRVNHLPEGFRHGQVVVNKFNGITEYGYQWLDDRNDMDRKRKMLWVRVVCWPKASKLAHLRNAPLQLGTFSGDTKTVKIGSRRVITQAGDGALGPGRYAGWVEREGVVVTVMASKPLVPQLGKIIKGIKL
ncbi:hypothetical protein FHU36_006582 [Nonomuraea muscovyensis]|uniref:Uncharacterized protein n=1 Tax=Nonomuraea muscovyensis TaxID=1124761 RepID=A0A7X0C9K1_9ACTN|nr:hypothetical protein [Nonomuraea muscovyensis]MBB6350010.1 hypothetical protein [Nonomuraea muscovyensis]